MYVGSIVGPPVRHSIRPIDRSIELAGGRCRRNLAQSAAGKEGEREGGRRHQFSHLDRLIISYPGECVRGRGGGRRADRVVCSLHNEEIPPVHLGKDGRTDGIDGGRGMMMERTDAGGTRWIRDCCGMY